MLECGFRSILQKIEITIINDSKANETKKGEERERDAEY